MADVVVGVDGSPESFAALRLASREARWRASRLNVVYVYEPPRARDADMVATVAATGSWSNTSSTTAMLRDAHQNEEEEQEQARRHAQGRLRQFLHEADVELGDLDVEQTAVGGERPAAVLLRLSQNAEMLVVGWRGGGKFKGLLLGSVSYHVVRHAACPVIIARP